MDENVQVVANEDAVVDTTTDVTTDESTGKGKIIFFAILGVVICAPVAAIVFGILWIKGRKKNKQLQEQLDAKSTETAPVQAVAPKADEPKKEETPKEETK